MSVQLSPPVWSSALAVVMIGVTACGSSSGEGTSSTTELGAGPRDVGSVPTVVSETSLLDVTVAEGSSYRPSYVQIGGDVLTTGARVPSRLVQLMDGELVVEFGLEWAVESDAAAVRWLAQLPDGGVAAWSVDAGRAAVEIDPDMVDELVDGDAVVELWLEDDAGGVVGEVGELSFADAATDDGGLWGDPLVAERRSVTDSERRLLSDDDGNVPTVGCDRPGFFQWDYGSPRPDERGRRSDDALVDAVTTLNRQWLRGQSPEIVPTAGWVELVGDDGISTFVHGDPPWSAIVVTGGLADEGVWRHFNAVVCPHVIGSSSAGLSIDERCRGRSARCTATASPARWSLSSRHHTRVASMPRPRLALGGEARSW